MSRSYELKVTVASIAAALGAFALSLFVLRVPASLVAFLVRSLVMLLVPFLLTFSFASLYFGSE